jgi:hypothetical protein
MSARPAKSASPGVFGHRDFPEASTQTTGEPPFRAVTALRLEGRSTGVKWSHRIARRLLDPFQATG